MTRALATPFAVLLLLLPAVAAAQQAPRPPRPQPTRAVAVHVVDLSADVAYIEPGAEAGVSTGQFATFGKKRFWVTATNAKYAQIALEGQQLGLGAEGSVRVVPGEDRERGLLRPDADARAHEGQWPRPTLPAQRAHVRPVPLGSLQRAGRTELALIERTNAVVPLDGENTSQGHTELRARLATEPFAGVPLAFRADASWLWYWTSRDLPGPRSPWQVRELELRYGAELAGVLRAGRMRSAAPTLGAVDGMRAQSGYLGPIAIGGFGGFAPTTLDEQFETDNTHFGADVQFSDPESRLRPYAALVAHATTFDGDIDQRRLDLFARMTPGPLRLSGGMELALWEEPDLFQAEPVEITFAHAGAQVQLGRFDAGARFSTFVPDRSRALAAEFPLVQLCNTALDDLTCLGAYARRFTTGVDLGLDLGDARVEAGGTAYTEAGGPFFQGITGQLGVRFFDPIAPSGALRESGLELAAIAMNDPLLSRAGLRIAADLRFAAPFELGLGYEPGLLRYVTDTTDRVTHGIDLLLSFGIGTSLNLALLGQALLGGDVDAIYLMNVLEARP